MVSFPSAKLQLDIKMVTSKLLSHISENKHLLVTYENWPSLYINENGQIGINVGEGDNNYHLCFVIFTLDFSFCLTANSTLHKSYEITKSDKGEPACSLLATKSSADNVQAPSDEN
jgi:hypothetical protein